MLKALAALVPFVASVVLLCCGQEPDEAAKRKDATIRELLALTNADRMGLQAIDQMGETFGRSMPPDFADFWAAFRRKVRVGDLEDLIVPIYARHFTQEELDELVRFNRTPIGRKLAEAMPKVVQESLAAGSEWGRRLAESAMKEYEAQKGR